jgi:ferredoxin
MPTVVFTDTDGRLLTISAPEGGSLARLCDEVDSPVPLHCRRGNCGTCRIEVLQGADQLLPPQAQELRLLALLGLAPACHRLACQARMQPGTARLQLRPLGRKAPRPRSVRIPVELGPGAMRVRMPATIAGNVLITGADSLDRGAVVLFDFHPPGASGRRQVMARVSTIESDGPGAGGHERAVATVELLEHDDVLVSLVRPAVPATDPPAG